MGDLPQFSSFYPLILDDFRVILDANGLFANHVWGLVRRC
jgi:hypothetical protein